MIYDNSVDIKKYYLTRGLLGLLDLRADRMHAGYDRHERMNEFIVCGKWYLDTCGNFGDFETDESVTKLLSDVVNVKDITNVLSKVRLSSSLPCRLPKLDSVCSVCNKNWTLENANDVKLVNDSEYYHKNCWNLKSTKHYFDYFQEVFTAAGFELFVLNVIPNEYSKDFADVPWFLVQTIYGTIKIGWRKRVIEIDWSKINKDIDGNLLFASENVTKNYDCVHAWGKDKAIEYLTKIRESLLQ